MGPSGTPQVSPGLQAALVGRPISMPPASWTAEASAKEASPGCQTPLSFLDRLTMTLRRLRVSFNDGRGILPE